MKRTSRIGWARSWRLLWVQLWVLLLLSACAGSPTQRATPSTATSGSGNADDMAANALALWGGGGANASQALAQMQKAAQSDPQRPELVWLYLRLCVEVKGCEPEPIEAHLRKLDPGSGAVWLGPLARAQASRDVRTEEQILEVMSKAAHFNVYWTTLVARLTPPLSHTPVATSVAQPMPTPLTNALNSTVGWLSSLATSAFKPLNAACDERHVREPETRVRCEQVAQALQKSDTTLAEGLGLGMAQRLAIPNSANALRLQEKVAILRHQNQASGSVVAAQVEKDKFSEQMLKLMSQLKQEQEVARAILRWAGQPLTP